MVIRHRSTEHFRKDERLGTYGNTVAHLGFTRGPCLYGEWDDPTWVPVEIDHELAPNVEEWRQRKRDMVAWREAWREAKRLGVPFDVFEANWESDL
jgi:hypothetical protein